jgi:mxaK protein
MGLKLGTLRRGPLLAALRRRPRLAALPRGTHRVLVALLLLAAAAAFDGARTWRLERWNGQIAAGEVPPDAVDAPPQAQFAQAYALAASGAGEEAMKGYRALQDSTPLGQAARYNTANLLMRQAAAVRAGDEPGKAIPLIELAKAMYRDILRADPEHWPARYNLERAQRMQADADEAEELPAAVPRDAERAATTMRGYSPGLP